MQIDLAVAHRELSQLLEFYKNRVLILAQQVADLEVKVKAAEDKAD